MMDTNATSDRSKHCAGIGIVVIGRNEGDRLRVCLESCVAQGRTVYVDSGSSDGSREVARRLGADVVLLDSSIPFTAARARNEGFARLIQLEPAVAYVQFVDGDCELNDGWISKATVSLNTETDTAIVCGRLRERNRTESVYNRLCDLEWSEPPGIVSECGGIALMRVKSFQEANGFDPTIIAGEEPDLCFRLRSAGWTIRRLDCEMGLHDAAMTHFGQWWRRAIRSGFAFAAGAWRHRVGPSHYWVRQTARAWLWGVALPIAAICLAVVWRPIALFILSAYALPLLRALTSARQRGASMPDALAYGFFCLLSKWAELIGQLKFIKQLITSRQEPIIEYKSAAIQSDA